ncbi:MAG: hypothetical protein HYY05_00590 [Chloroflexi bacterium]|nr:hypothetical protein [Chloroflexota bacterium]
MSTYELSRLLFDLKMRDEMVEEYAAHPEAVMGRYGLTPEERAALGEGDPRKLRALGVHGFLALYVLRPKPEFRENVYWRQK